MAPLPDPASTQQTQASPAAPAAQATAQPGKTKPAQGLGVGNLPAATAPVPPQITPSMTADPLAFPDQTITPSFAPANVQQAPTSDAAPMTMPAPQATPSAPASPPQYTGPAASAGYTGPSLFGEQAGVSGTDSPLHGLTEQQKKDYWAGKGAINPSSLGLGTDATPAQIATGTSAYQAQHANDIDAITKQVTGQQAANLTAERTNAQTFDDNQNKAAYGALATALNGQQGYAGSGDAYLDPNAPTQGFLGNGPSLGQGGAAPTTIANPISNAQTTPNLGPNVVQSAQDKPTDQGGTVTPVSQPTIPTSLVNGLTGPSNSLPGVTALTAPTSNNGGVSLTPTDPSNALTDQTISAGPTADRVKTFQDALNSTIHNVIDPSYETSARNLNRYNFGAGRGVSGAARTSQGDLAAQRDRQIADLSAQGLAGATTGSIDDAFKKVGIAQQQQGFQQGQSNDAFNQQAELAQLQDALTNSSFDRAHAESTAGEANSPANIALILSQIFGNQAGQAGQAASGAFQNLGKNSAGGGGLSIADLLKFLQGQGGGASSGPTTGSQPTRDDGQ